MTETLGFQRVGYVWNGYAQAEEPKACDLRFNLQPTNLESNDNQLPATLVEGVHIQSKECVYVEQWTEHQQKILELTGDAHVGLPNVFDLDLGVQANMQNTDDTTGAQVQHSLVMIVTANKFRLNLQDSLNNLIKSKSPLIKEDFREAVTALESQITVSKNVKNDALLDKAILNFFNAWGTVCCVGYQTGVRISFTATANAETVKSDMSWSLLAKQKLSLLVGASPVTGSASASQSISVDKSEEKEFQSIQIAFERLGGSLETFTATTAPYFDVSSDAGSSRISIKINEEARKEMIDFFQKSIKEAQNHPAVVRLELTDVSKFFTTGLPSTTIANALSQYHGNGTVGMIACTPQNVTVVRSPKILNDRLPPNYTKERAKKNNQLLDSLVIQVRSAITDDFCLNVISVFTNNAVKAELERYLIKYLTPLVRAYDESFIHWHKVDNFLTFYWYDKVDISSELKNDKSIGPAWVHITFNCGRTIHLLVVLHSFYRKNVFSGAVIQLNR